MSSHLLTQVIPFNVERTTVNVSFTCQELNLVFLCDDVTELVTVLDW